MYYIQKLPYILAAFMTFIIGAASAARGTAKNIICIRMLVSLVVFLVIGFVSRAIILSVYEENMRINQNELTEDMINKMENRTQSNISTIDIKIDDSTENKKYEEAFTPFKVSEVIKSKLKEE